MSYKPYRAHRRHRLPRRTRMIAFRAVVILICCLIVAGCLFLAIHFFGKGPDEQVTVSESPTLSSSSQLESIISEEPSSLSSSSEEIASSSQPDAAPSSSDDSDYSIFDNTVFVGNSVIDDLDTYNILPNADFFARTGLTVTSVMTKSTVKGSVPVIDELNGKSYDKVFLMFGLNELGWEYPSIFQEDYGKVIDEVRARQPDAEIYVQSLLPVSAEASQKNQNNVNNDRIREYNQLLQELAQEKGVIYLDVASALQDSEGNLPAEASADGIHPNMAYCQRWVDYIRDSL